jgi:hypothetical protein
VIRQEAAGAVDRRGLLEGFWGILGLQKVTRRNQSGARVGNPQVIFSPGIKC